MKWDWINKHHPSEQPAQALEALLTHTGLGDKIQKDLDDGRAAKFEALRRRKVDSVARFQRGAAPANAAVAAAEEKEKQARKLADEAIKDYVKAREQHSTVYETHRNECAELDREMLTCYDPAIDAFIAELHELRRTNQQRLRSWPDEKGELLDVNRRRMSDNSDAVNRRDAAIFHLAHDVVPTLRTAHHVADVAAEIERLRNTIPEA
jgi:hypothetical protein